MIRIASALRSFHPSWPQGGRRAEITFCQARFTEATEPKTRFVLLMRSAEVFLTRRSEVRNAYEADRAGLRRFAKLRGNRSGQMLMTSAPQQGDTVKAALLAAFADAPYPGDEYIVVDQDVFDPESAEIVRAFTGMKWQDVPVEMVRRFKEALPLFTPEAFGFYVPAYMTACVDAPHEVDVALDSVLFNLTPPVRESGWQWDFFRARIEEFNGPQVAAIQSFLALMNQRELADWEREGMVPPRERIGRAIDFWAAR